MPESLSGHVIFLGSDLDDADQVQRLRILIEMDLIEVFCMHLQSGKL